VSTRKLTPEQAARGLLEELADDAAIEQALAASPEQIARALEADGMDVAAEQAALNALLDAAPAAAPAPAPGAAEPRPERAEVVPIVRARDGRRGRIFSAVGWAAAAAVALTVGRAIYLRQPDGRPDIRADDTRPSPARLAREEATRACDQERWDDCRARLDDARRLDPAGESAPAVVQLRARLDQAAVVPDAAAAPAPDAATRPAPEPRRVPQRPRPAPAPRQDPPEGDGEKGPRHN
jgi:hypothetical protein